MLEWPALLPLPACVHNRTSRTPAAASVLSNACAWVVAPGLQVSLLWTRCRRCTSWACKTTSLGEAPGQLLVARIMNWSAVTSDLSTHQCLPSPSCRSGRDWIAGNMTFEHQGTGSFFEAVIRVLGGLVSLYDLTGDRMFLDKATVLGDRLLPALAAPGARRAWQLQWYDELPPAYSSAAQ